MRINIPNVVAAAVLFLLFVAMLVSFGFGVAVERFRIYPYPLIAQVDEALKSSVEMAQGEVSWFYKPTAAPRIQDNRPLPRSAGFNLITSIGDDRQLSALVMNMDGDVVHEWNVDWFDVWPNAEHLTEREVPKGYPGTQIHGIAMFENGDILYNYGNLGLVRMDLCGEVVWKLPMRTHHSVEFDDDGNIWVPSKRIHTEPLPDFPSHQLPITEDTILKVSPNGEVLKEISVFELLAKNDLRALLHLPASINNNMISGNSLHINDVEPLPAALAETSEEIGDVMVSLRNINAVLIFNVATEKVRFVRIGGFVRQHDPDFLPDGRISVYDNNHIGPKSYTEQQSRIVVLSPTATDMEVRYEGNAEAPFFSDIMGKHQWLENGNVLITDSMNGRAIEVNADGQIVWEFTNIRSNGYAGIVSEVQRLPDAFLDVFKPGATGQSVCQP